MTTKIELAVSSLVTEAAGRCGIGASCPPVDFRGSGGHVDLWASDVTQGGPAELLRCIAVLGVSRGPWQPVQLYGAAWRRADLSDLGGEIRGSVLVGPVSGSAKLCYAVTRPLECFEIEH